MFASRAGALRRALEIAGARPSLLFLSIVPRRLLHGVQHVRGNEEATTIHPTAVVHPGAVIGQGVSIGPFCTIGSAVKVGNSCQIYSGSHISGDTELGEQCVVLNQGMSVSSMLVKTMKLESTLRFIDLPDLVIKQLLVTAIFSWVRVILLMTAKLVATTFLLITLFWLAMLRWETMHALQAL